MCQYIPWCIAMRTIVFISAFLGNMFPHSFSLVALWSGDRTAVVIIKLFGTCPGVKEEDEKLLLILYGGSVGNVPRRGAAAAASSSIMIWFFGGAIATTAATDWTRIFVNGKSLFDRFFHFLDHYGWLALAAAFGTVVAFWWCGVHNWWRPLIYYCFSSSRFIIILVPLSMFKYWQRPQWCQPHFIISTLLLACALIRRLEIFVRRQPAARSPGGAVHRSASSFMRCVSQITLVATAWHATMLLLIVESNLNCSWWH